MHKLVICACGTMPEVKYARREGEGEDEDENLISTHCYEAWVDCPGCGRHSPRMVIECWSDERPLDEPLTKFDISKAKSGAAKAWNWYMNELTKTVS